MRAVPPPENKQENHAARANNQVTISTHLFLGKVLISTMPERS